MYCPAQLTPPKIPQRNHPHHVTRTPYNRSIGKAILLTESTITAKGQTTVPADIRALVGAVSGTRLVWSAMPDGTIIVRAKTKSILDMAAMLKAPKGKRVSINDMNPLALIPALDTNVLVRYIVQDHAAQLGASKRLISRLVAEGSTLFVPVTVVLELDWVLRSRFGFAQDDVLLTMSSLFSAAELTFESERALEVALHLFRDGSADVADCLHVALANQAGEQPLLTFDKGAAKVSGAQLLVME